MNAPSIDIKDMLEANSELALEFNTDLFVGREPNKPNNTVTVFDTPGFPTDVTFKKGENYMRPSAQVRVRNTDYETGWALIQNIHDLLHGTTQETWNGTLYSVITAGSPTMLDWDDNNRARFIINLNLQRR